MHISIIGYALYLAGMQEVRGKNISGVHMPYSADWSGSTLNFLNFCWAFQLDCDFIQRPLFEVVYLFSHMFCIRSL